MAPKDCDKSKVASDAVSRNRNDKTLTKAADRSTHLLSESCNPKSGPRTDGEGVSFDPHALGLVKAAYSVNEVLSIIPLGRTSLYAAVKRRELNASKFGKKTIFLTPDLAAFLLKLKRVTRGV
jgi:hypothetical protein